MAEGQQIIGEALDRDDVLATGESIARVQDRSGAIAWPDGHVESFEANVEGTLVWPPRGDKGFGYDPMFIPNGSTATFGEMDAAEKHAVSHRARAFAQFLAACLRYDAVPHSLGQ